MTVFLDANALIYLIEGAEPFAASVRQQLRTLAAAGTQPVRVAMSLLSRLECRVRPLRMEDNRLLADYDAFFARPDLTLVPLSADVVELTTAIRVRHGLRTPDALQAASCLQLGDSAVFLTGDRIFQRVAGLRVALVV